MSNDSISDFDENNDISNNKLPDDENVSSKDLKKQLDTLKNKLDYQIGFYWWKKYIAGAFWSNISTPVNLCITLITALTTGQAATKDLIPENIYINLSISVLVISTLNTFFRPHLQMMENIGNMQKWTEFGCKFSNILNNIERNNDGKYIFNLDNTDNLKEKLGNLRELQKNIYEHITTKSSVNQNFLTDLIHVIARKTCLGEKERWSYLEEIDYYRKYTVDEKSKKCCICC